MADNTRVNELQEKLLKAMDILNAQALNSVSFDKTITCKIENDKDKKDGKYEVNDGNRIFTAYSTDTNFRAGDTVYVTVPEGNFENQKMIIGKKTADNNKPFNFTQPFDTFFDMTGNIAVGAAAVEAVANNEKDKRITILCEEDEQGNIVSLDVSNKDIIKYTRLAIRANFRSWIKNAVSGNYGIDIILTTDKPNITTGNTKNGTYTYRFDSSMFYGNPYNFETYYSQELVLDLEKQDIGKVIGIRVDFYQDEVFKDRKGNELPAKENDNSLLAPNLFVNDLELYFGYDISIFNEDYVEIYTADSLKFGNTIEKNISTRWVHLNEGTPLDMRIEKNHNNENINYEIRWYKYILGAAAADEYCGVYWDRINPATGNRLFYRDSKYYEKEFVEAEGKEQDKEIIDLDTKSFNCKFTPDCKKNQERIKCIILVDNNMPYRSNEILFENEKEVIDTSIQTFVNALQIKEDDNTNGNYMIYGQNNNLLDSEDTKIVRTLSAYFDTNGDGKTESLVQPNDNLQWIFPNNSMIILQNGDPLLDEEGNEQKDENGNIIRSNIVTKNQPEYKIASYYSPGKSNNTIQCIYTNNDIVYTTEKEFTFGPSGTMGTDQTIVIDFIGDTKALLVGTEIFQMQVQVYNNKNELLTDIPENITWSWLHCAQDSDNISYLQIPNKEIDNEGREKSHPSIIDITVREGFNIDQLYILQVQVGNLITYFPIPIKSSENYSYITGATQVIYQSDGEPNYSKEVYTLCDNSGKKETGIEWEIKHLIPNDKLDKEEKFIGTIKSYKDGEVLEPLSLYVKDAPVYGVQALSGSTVLWTQPILILQNKWSSNVINKWDGKSLQLNEDSSSILAAAIAAGKKNSDDNTFSGVMIGDWSGKDLDTNASITNQTGIYGFHHGAMSYALTEDGNAFFGKGNRGRIYINGDSATLYSHNWTNGGMQIDLDEPSIKMTDGKNNYITLNAAKGKTHPFTIGDKFSVKWDGTIKAEDGDFSGKITSDQGNIGGWKISPGMLSSYNDSVTLNSNGTIKGAYIDGATISGGTITTEQLYAGLSTYYKYRMQISYDNGTTWIDTNTFVAFGADQGQYYKVSNSLQYYREEKVEGELAARLGSFTGSIGNNISTPVVGISVLDQTVSMVLESKNNIRLTASNTVYLDADEIEFTCDAENQHGIYARFA